LGSSGSGGFDLEIFILLGEGRRKKEEGRRKRGEGRRESLSL
jgi:hypothetical protein